MIEVRGLRLRRGRFSLRGIDLRVERGECFVVVGPSGAGKTLLLESILGIHQPDAGQVLVEGADVTRLPPELRGFSYVPQDLALFPHLGVYDNIAFARHNRAPAGEVARAVREAAGWLGIGHLLERRSVASLSGGEKQRVALARALVAAPRVLFLDEPFNSLDLALRVELYRELVELRRHMRLTTLLVTHDHDEAFVFGDHMAVMIEGRLLQVGTPEEVYRRPATVEAARLLLVENLLPAELSGPGRTPGTAVFRAAGLEFEARARDDLAPGQPLWLGFRAQHVRIVEAGSQPVDGRTNCFHVRLQRVLARAGRRLLQVSPDGRSEPLLLVSVGEGENGFACPQQADLTVEIPLEQVLVFDGRKSSGDPRREAP